MFEVPDTQFNFVTGFGLDAGQEQTFENVLFIGLQLSTVRRLDDCIAANDLERLPENYTKVNIDTDAFFRAWSENN